MGESRQELLNWLNGLLQLNITRVEQCGTGAALCQVFDSIFGDVPMPKVKFNVNTEYAYLQNFKILTSVFTAKAIDRPIPVERLVKCKFQDNLEFLQWTKRYWDQYYPGGEYDALSRRKGAGSVGGNHPPPRVNPSSAAAKRGTTPTVGGARTRTPLGGASAAVLQQENSMLKENVTGLERERDFYFSKLRDIELLVQQAVEQDPDIEKDEDGLVKHIQTILYSTEDGFEIPAEEEGDDLETF
ncbi:calponin homology domain-containing protein [Tuber brumale]|nr:calponin homology domain-containing protein [Tuber brumale]